jgi:hypothetical protein
MSSKQLNVFWPMQKKKLSDAIKVGDMCQVSVASGLLEVGRKRIAEANRELTDIVDRRKKIKFN